LSRETVTRYLIPEPSTRIPLAIIDNCNGCARIRASRDGGKGGVRERETALLERVKAYTFHRDNRTLSIGTTEHFP
jgi:hypothetical protein